MSTRPSDEGGVADLAAHSSNERRRHRRPDDLAPYGLGERGVTYLAADIHPLRQESPPSSPSFAAVIPDQRRRFHGVADHAVSPRRCSPRASSAPPSPHQRSRRSPSPRPRRRVGRSRSSPPSIHDRIDGSPLPPAPHSFKELVCNLTKDQVLDLLAFAWEADPQTRLAIEREVDSDADRRTLFLRDLPNDIPWRDVYDYFDGWGRLEWCRIHRNTSKRRVTGHVRFVHRQHALRAARFPGKFIDGHSFSCVPHDPAFVPLHRQSGFSLDHEVHTTGLPDVQDVHRLGMENNIKIHHHHHLGFNTQILHHQQPPQSHSGFATFHQQQSQPHPGYATQILHHQQPPQSHSGFATFHQQQSQSHPGFATQILHHQPQLQPHPGFATQILHHQPQLQPHPGFATQSLQQQPQPHPGFATQSLQQQQIHHPQQPLPQSHSGFATQILHHQPRLQPHPGFATQSLQQQPQPQPQPHSGFATQSLQQQLPPPPPPAAASSTTAIFSEVRGDQVYGPEHHRG